MAKKAKKKFTKEWVELTLCDMVDEILHLISIIIKKTVIGEA